MAHASSACIAPYSQQCASPKKCVQIPCVACGCEHYTDTTTGNLKDPYTQDRHMTRRRDQFRLLGNPHRRTNAGFAHHDRRKCHSTRERNISHRPRRLRLQPAIMDTNTVHSAVRHGPRKGFIAHLAADRSRRRSPDAHTNPPLAHRNMDR